MNTRRGFLRGALSLGAMTAVGGFSRLGLLQALTQPTGSYRALVCVFLYGGNDSNNMVIPLDPAGYGKYKAVRSGLALDSATLLPIDANKAFGLHPQFKDLIPLAAHTAVVANVGTLVSPLTRDQYQKQTGPLPENLFSHSDQQNAWQTSVAQGQSITGWAGRLADQVSHLNGGKFPTVTSVAGSALFSIGASTHPGSVTPGGAIGLQGFGTDAASKARKAALQALSQRAANRDVTTDSGAVLVREGAVNMNNALADADVLSAALKGAAGIKTVFPTTSIGKQLLEVAQLIQVKDALGMNRQIFFCSLGGFDTHTDQLATQDKLYSQLSPALAAFYAATEELRLADQVTTFTSSDFSRTLQPNSNGGSDHGWGSHHLVMGAGIAGAKLYGTFPDLSLNGANDAGEGRWIPTTAVDQYGATLARWFGLDASLLPAVFPNIANFGSSDLGFFA